MAENLLNHVLNGEIGLEKLYNWILSPGNEGKHEFKFGCSQGDFLSFFLNYIHEEAAIIDKANDTPQKVHTPKSIRKSDIYRNDSKIKKRPALFTESKKQTLEARILQTSTLKTSSDNSVSPNDTSTPKTKYEAYNTSYASPVSPIYTKMMLHTPKNRNKPQPILKSMEKSVCFGDYITHSKKGSSKKKVNRNLSNLQENLEPQQITRRINPTNLSQSKFKESFHRSGNSFNFNNDLNGVDRIPDVKSDLHVVKSDSTIILDKPPSGVIKIENNVNENAQTLSPKRLAPNTESLTFSQLKTKIDMSTLKTPNKLSTLARRKEILPNFENVTNQVNIDILVKLYNFILANNLALNVTSEIYFIISLILSNQFEMEGIESTNNFNVLNNHRRSDEKLSLSILNDKQICDTKPILEDASTSKTPSKLSLSMLNTSITTKNIFTSLHNTVYFACKVFELQLNVLMLLDRSCLKMLLENQRFQLLCPTIFGELTQMYEDKIEVKKEICEVVAGNVCFMSDTDNRENFPTEVSFHAFRKQRDLFYEILRIWEHSHLEDGWSFVSLSGKIRSLLNLHLDSGNFRHFCRLFKAQLLSTCVKHNENALHDNQLSFLSVIPNINSEKLSRLKNRLVTKTSSNGINATPTFPGLQEFYKDFILFAAAHVFNAHLKDALICEILQLNDTKFSSNDLEDTDTTVDEETKKSYLMCLNSLRLLAKFLGFLESIPYRMENANISEKIAAAEIQTRDWLQPNFNLKTLLQNSIETKALILTIPWLTKYLSMLDYITLRLPYFYAIYGLLFETYFNLQTTKTNFNNVMLIKLCLGWLFELPNFPSEHYYLWCTQTMSRRPKSNIKSSILDHLDIVDRDVLYACCPYLDEFKKLLQTNSGSNNKVTVKHITPVTAAECAVDVNEKRIKIQLEEAFFNAQPMSMRKTVEFVSERIASSCVKTICNQIVPDFKLLANSDYKQMVSTVYKECVDMVEGEEETKLLFKQQVKTKSNIFLHKTIKHLLDLCETEMHKQLRLKIPGTIVLLLSDEELQQTKETCVCIATRITKDRVQQWVNAHVNTGIFTKDFDSEVMRTMEQIPAKDNKSKPVFALPSGGKDVVHNSTTESAVLIVDQIRDLTIDVLEHSNNVTYERISNLLKSAEESIKGRCDINECMLVLIHRLLLDLMLLIVAHKTDLCSTVLMMEFITFWRQFSSPNTTDLFTTIMCPRNVMFLGQSPEETKAWQLLSTFLSLLIKNKLLNAVQFNNQCATIFQNNWNDSTLESLANCFRDVAQNTT